MRNVADAIESFIIGELFADDNKEINVKRGELAEKLDCAPSQITYTLTTRFTPERGFEVESRRGSGGFIRIIKLQRASALPTADRQENAMNSAQMVAVLEANRMITPREGELLRYTLELLGEHVTEKAKCAMVREAYGRLSRRENE